MHGGFDFEAISNSFFIAVGSPANFANRSGMVVIGEDQNINCVIPVADSPLRP